MARPEPINATFHHSKAKVTLSFSDPLFVAGDNVSGKMELECKADRGLGVADIKVEFFAIQELTSRDHSATSTFLHLTRTFQGAGLPPSNSVHPHPPPGSEPLPVNYYHARKGTTTFFFQFPLPLSSPASIVFGKGIARLKYEVRASIGISWRNERLRLLDRKEVSVVEAMGLPCNEVGSERIVVGENGKIWMQGRIANSFVVSGQSTCVELFVKNHSAKKSDSLGLTLSRHLHLPSSVQQSNRSLQISDTLYGTSFRGDEYTVQPGTEGVANLVFTVPKDAEGVRSGPLETGEDDPRQRETLFDVRCLIEIRLGFGIGTKDVLLELPVTIIHPAALGPYSPPERLALSPTPYSQPISPPALATSPAPYLPPMSPPFSYSNFPAPQPVDLYSLARIASPVYNHFPGYVGSPPIPQPMYDQQYYYPPPLLAPYQYPIRPSSADPFVAQQLPVMPGQDVVTSPPKKLDGAPSAPEDVSTANGEVGKGERASRISAHLRLSSRTRSVSPKSHRFPQTSTATGAMDEYNGLSPQTLHPETGNLGSPVSNASPRSVNKLDANVPVLSPRPILSHKNSFTVDHGTVKSERVVDLERMAAGEEKSSKNDPGKQVRLSQLDIYDDPGLPPQPVLAPVSINRGRDYQLEDGGLDALERRLLAQVGTRKPEPERKPDVRAVLSTPISIPSKNVQRDPANDSAISSLALAADGLRSTPASPAREKRLPTPPVEQESINKEEAVNSNEERPSERTKYSASQKLRKAATSRVAAWLGGISDAAAPPVVDTPSTASPKSPIEEITPLNEPEPHPLLRSPPLPTSPEQNALVELPLGEQIPARSSGFILHSARDPTETFGPDGPTDNHPEPTRSKTPTQADVSANARHNTSPQAANSLKPVLKRFVGAYGKSTAADLKYDIRSARGGRGGRVTSVAALWSSLATQENTNPQVKPSHIPSENPQSRPQTKPHPAVSSPTPIRKTPEVLGNLNVADLTQRRARMVKSASVPAVVSSSLATPVISSTASLARPIKSQYPKQSYPAVATNFSTNLSPSTPPGIKQHGAKPVVSGDLAVGQTRLKELIKKYQQGIGQ